MMDIDEALEVMYNGGHVQSLVSKTIYNLEKKNNRYKLYAEGEPVDISFLTREEVCGKFVEIEFIITEKEFNSLDKKEQEQLIDNVIEDIQDREKYYSNKK